MIKSMTGFAMKEAKVALLGKACVELRSANHKFLEIVFHLPEGFLSLEDKLKKEIETRIKRGRVNCAVNITGRRAGSASVNEPLLKDYVAILQGIKKKYQLRDDLSVDTLIRLPGVLSTEDAQTPSAGAWPRLKALVESAVSDLDQTRLKEGRALCTLLRNRAESLSKGLSQVKERFKQVTHEKVKSLGCDEERKAFLKESDITEEIERLAFHIRNFKSKLKKSGPIGKELDFIAQEMQREINTLAAKSPDSAVSGRALVFRSQVEKIREQVQNIE